MGCVGTRSDLVNIEKAFIEAERGLNFQLCRSNYVDLIFRKYSCNGEINESQFAEATEKLSLSANDGFYGQFKDGEVWNFKLLNLLGILLSRGDTETKAQLMFQLYDPENSKTITTENIQDLFESIWTVSVQFIPTLVSDTSNKFLKPGEVKEYLQKLESSRENLIKYMMAKFTQKSIDSQTFVEAFMSEDMESLVSPFGIRTFAKKLKILDLNL